MKPEIYILLLGNNQYYVGSSNNLIRRIEEHKSGRVQSTKYKLPVRLIFHQEFATLKEARQIEFKIKKQKSRVFIEKILDRGFV